MFLQDLIRNVFLYKGVLQPFIKSWRESFFTLYSKQNTHYLYQISDFPLPKRKKNKSRFSIYCSKSLKIGIFPLADNSGTYTITNIQLWNKASTAPGNVINGHEHNSTSNNIIGLLTDELYSENIAISVKNKFSHSNSTATFLVLNSNIVNFSTTGFTKINVNTFLISETHEKREYLGEFSLTHEETPLLYLKRGGDYHETDEKPVTASF